MTPLEDLIVEILRVVDYLRSTDNPFDRAWANHLALDAKAMQSLAQAGRHLTKEEVNV